METIPWSQLVVRSIPRGAEIDPIAGRLLGDVTVKELMQAITRMPVPDQAAPSGVAIDPFRPMVLLPEDEEE